MIQLDLRPDRNKLRNFGFIAFVAFSLVAAYVAWKKAIFGFELGTNTDTVLIVLGALAVSSAVFSLIWPSGNRAVYVILTIVTFPIGIVVSNVMLLVLFYGVFTPIGLIFRIIGRDALKRKYEPSLASYWVAYPQRKDRSYYFRQF